MMTTWSVDPLTMPTSSRNVAYRSWCYSRARLDLPARSYEVASRKRSRQKESICRNICGKSYVPGTYYYIIICYNIYTLAGLSEFIRPIGRSVWPHRCCRRSTIVYRIPPFPSSAHTSLVTKQMPRYTAAVVAVLVRTSTSMPWPTATLPFDKCLGWHQTKNTNCR